MSQINIVAGIIVLLSCFVVFINIGYFYFKGLFQNNYEVLRHTISGIGAAILAPIIFKSLVPEVPEYNNFQFLVISGMCFMAGYLSDKFINYLGKYILLGFVNTKDKVEKIIPLMNESEALKNFSASNVAEQNTLQVEGNNNISFFDIKVQEGSIMKSFTEKNKIRTSREIAVELDANSLLINNLLENLHEQGKLKKLTCLNGNVHWALTQLGITLVNGEN